MVPAELAVHAIQDADYFRQVADTIGGTTSPEQIQFVVDSLNFGGHIVHGVRRNEYFPGVCKDGVLPLTPEGGNVSMWTTGRGVFGSMLANGRISTYDTSFFHYAHSYDPSPEEAFMTLAITNVKLMLQDAPIVPNWGANLKDPVGRDALALLRVCYKGEEQGRQRGQRVEQEMLTLLQEVLEKGYEGGELFQRTVLK